MLFQQIIQNELSPVTVNFEKKDILSSFFLLCVVFSFFFLLYFFLYYKIVLTFLQF